ncbi:unnamed protein product (macronuclear) [Paramecium tetraurelia]|uniref:RING-type domain-containing protein n=1 Tax=Paramecium tetraurelia TaxID=5888 RepID=A0CED9_PARTE|nr:uncharacterized protein GSPATT00037593001 [Paramecium tetraurelia]CAK69156.1 unnamed protein product [Paramecium tetraurelia]|eukprot:XP_001436553.1 hypothetical protein (macronuclear) [Paramecium tetraurelia strain d4-2]
MKLGIYEVGFIPPAAKRQFYELQPYSQLQYLGKNLLSAFFIALLDYFIAQNKSQSMETLAKPKRIYTKGDNLKIAQQIYNLRIGNISMKEFFIFLKNIDINNQKGQQLLEEFCELQELRVSVTNNKITIESIARLFSISVNLLGQQQLGYTSKQKIFLLLQTDGYYLIKQTSPLIQYIIQAGQPCNICYKKFDNYFINSNCLHINCRKCLVEKIKKGNPNSNNQVVQCSCSCKEKILIKDAESYLNEELKIEALRQQKDQQLNLQKSQQFTNDKSKGYGYTTEVLDKNQKPVQQNKPIEQIEQQCNYCYQPSSKELFVNKQCSHRFCTDCFKQRITSKGQKCVVEGCEIIIDDLLFQQRVQLEDDITRIQKVVQTQKQQLGKCTKCNNETQISRLYKDKRCKHYTCFPCIHVHVEMQIQKQPNTYNFTCPSCDNIYGVDFDTFYEQQQLSQLEERMKYEELFQQEKEEREERELKEFQALKQQQEKQIIPDKVIQYPSRFINYKQLQQVDQDEKSVNSQSGNDQVSQSTQEQKIQKDFKQFEQGECTMCFTSFSEYNLRQEIDCTKHKIGVCCSVKFLQCPQCEQKKVNTSMIRIKPKLMLQTFVQKLEFMGQSGIYNSSMIKYNNVNADDQTRLNSRANLGQSQIKSSQRNSTMDTQIFRSQAPQSKEVGVYGGWIQILSGQINQRMSL